MNWVLWCQITAWGLIFIPVATFSAEKIISATKARQR